MRKVDITKQCRVEISISRSGEALIYLSKEGEEEKIGLFDKHGFHFMMGQEGHYDIKDCFKASAGIIWFKVYEKR